MAAHRELVGGARGGDLEEESGAIGPVPLTRRDMVTSARVPRPRGRATRNTPALAPVA
jgi:hypothetical protein